MRISCLNQLLKIKVEASPLILLAKIRRLELLAWLYDEVIIPASVLGEVEGEA